MARGWESKSVESQIESAAELRKAAAAAAALQPSPDQMNRARERASLELSRIRVMHDLEHAANPRYRAQLEAALEHLEKKITGLTLA